MASRSISIEVQRAGLVDAGSSCPIEDVRESPGVLTQIQLQLALLVEDQLRLGIERPGALALVLGVEFEDAGGETEGLRLRVGEGFTETDLTIGDEDDLATGWRCRHLDVGAVVAECASDLDVAYGLHLRQGGGESLVLALLEGLNQGDSVGGRRVLVDVQGDADVLTHLRAGAKGLGFEGFVLVTGEPRMDGEHDDAQYEKTPEDDLRHL
jgi:hypothetical protein